mgnify:FL=1
MTEHGGHLGFFTKTGRTSVDPYTWLERMTIQYIDALLCQHKVYQKQCGECEDIKCECLKYIQGGVGDVHGSLRIISLNTEYWPYLRRF